MFDRLTIINNFLSKEECSDILIKYKDELVLRPGDVSGPEKHKRKSSVAFIKHIDIIDERLKNKLKEFMPMKGYEVTGLAPYQFTEYKVGEFYDWHTDSDNNDYKNRYVSIVIQLNDEYEGGYLQLKDDSGDNVIQLDKGIGNMYMFFSNIMHRVIPVNSGVRYSLVNWVSLNKIENYKKTLI